MMRWTIMLQNQAYYLYIIYDKLLKKTNAIIDYNLTLVKQ